jgi:putative oxidoreductase
LYLKRRSRRGRQWALCFSAKIPKRSNQIFCVESGFATNRGGVFMKSLNSLQPLGLLVLRVTLGLIFFSHGYPKVAHSAPGMQAFFVEHGLPGYFVYISGVLEVFGAILLAVGVFTRGAALLLAIEMGVAIWKVHSSGGYLAVHNYEFPLAMLAGSFALATVGAGLLSLDHVLFEGLGKSRPPR